jgi:hypothetical protein
VLFLSVSKIIEMFSHFENFSLKAIDLLQNSLNGFFNENINEAHLRWVDGTSVTEVLPILKRCTSLRRLPLEK